MTRYDLVVLGGGAAAFAAVTEADRRDWSVAVVNAGLPLGGTCANVGCVPSKHLLDIGHTAFEPPRTPHDAVTYRDRPAVDWGRAIADTDRLVDEIRESNYRAVAEAFGTDIVRGHGRFVDERTIRVTDGPDAGTTLTGETVLIATGSSPRRPPIEGLDAVAYETSETVLDREECPEAVVIVGGGPVGVEWAQILRHLGATVTICQRSDRLLPGFPPALGHALADQFAASGIDVHTEATVERVRADDTASAPAQVLVEARTGGEPLQVEGSTLFLAAGVTPNTADCGLDAAGVETRADGTVAVDETYRTSTPGVFAAGDCIGAPMLETVAAREGNFAVRNAAGASRSVDHGAVPHVVYTSPPVASIGTTEAEYREDHGTCACRTVDIADLPRAQAVGATRGSCQVVADHETRDIVGVHAIMPRADEVIAEAAMAVTHGLGVDDVIETIHPFPTFSEAFRRACQAFERDISTMSCCVE
ncbi:MAG: mercury(II) reductase [Halococcoides sp.]